MMGLVSLPAGEKEREREREREREKGMVRHSQDVTMCEPGESVLRT